MKYRQRLQVSFEYDVLFTRDLFAPANETLAEVLAQAQKAVPEGRAAARMAVFIDQGVLERWPGLPEKITRWCEAHSDAVRLVSPPLTVPGGEPVKNDLTFVQRMTHQF